ncbi:hypothetical protein ZIOFF_002118 [Zingiber officinale]|uniref:non-specific serine/threonine protein kinase n=2 Tax=Zingiber officinale TaxID=94328 RepID=A0A8J5IB03_ZINOF|nr:hypothetical protein ZIOFF_002118 [Zingiber officinale]
MGFCEDLLEVILVLVVFRAGSTQTNIARGFRSRAKVLGGVIMLTSFIFRVLILIFVYAYPAYECYKTLELNKQEIEQLCFWCQYWILFGLLRELGVFADILFSWLPFYYGAKLGAFLYLWHPRTKGATFVYETFLVPFIAEHEFEIDPSLFEFRARAADWGLIAWQMAVSYLQTSVPEMKKYAISLMPTMNSIEGEKNYIYFFFTSIYVVNDEPHRRGTTSNASALSNMTLEECQSLCWMNCSCVAFSMIRDNMCLSWPADLMDIRVFAQGGNDLYVRLAASELDSIRSSGKQKSLVIKVTVPVLSFLLLLCVGSFLWLERRSKLVKPDIVDPSTPKETELDLPLYSMVSIRAATNEFSRDNIVGMGGFGFIYKGKLADGQEVAVKRLSKASEQGTDEFKSEVSIIAKLQHRNLVRLLGYCIEDEERILIYEYMTNKSLDTFIFGHVQSVQSSQRS